MRRDLPSKFEPIFLSQNTVLTPQNVNLDGLFIVGTSGVTVTLPNALEAVNGAECIVVNNSSGAVTVACADGFPNDLDSVSLAAGQSMLLYCAPVLGGAYRWAAIGATVS